MTPWLLELKYVFSWGIHYTSSAHLSVSQSCSQRLCSLWQGRETRALGATISGMHHRCRLCSETGWAEFGYFLCHFKMVVPRALFFRLLVKGNQVSGNKIVCKLVYNHTLMSHRCVVKREKLCSSQWEFFLRRDFPVKLSTVKPVLAGRPQDPY